MANASARAASKQVFACETCGEKFNSYRALGGHMTKHKKEAAAPRAADFSVMAEVNESLREIGAPLLEQHKELTKRINVLQSELSDLREGRRRLEDVLKKLGLLAAAPPKPAGRGAKAGEVAARGQAQKTEKLRELIEQQEPGLMALFADETATANRISDWWAENEIEPPVSQKTTRVALEQLRDAGLVRADRVVKGGGMAWALITTNGGGGS